MNTSEETIIKFQACTGIEKSLLLKWVVPMEQHNIETEFNFAVFNKILVSNEMEEYSYLLFNYFIWNLNKIRSSQLFKNDYERFLAKINEERELHKELTKIIQFLLSQDKGNMTLIKFWKQRGECNVKNKYIIESINECIINKLKTEFEEKEYNLDTLSEEEAKEQIRKKPDLEWITNWKMEKEYCDSEGNRIYDDDFEDHSDYFNPETGESHDGNFIRNQMIQEYAESHVILRDVDLEFLDRIIAEGFGPKKKPGVPEKNKNIKPIATSLTYLCKVDRLLKTKYDGCDIEQIPLEKEDRIFIYDCLDFFSLIDKLNISPPKKYITTFLDQIKKPNNPELFRKLRMAKFNAMKVELNSISPK